MNSLRGHTFFLKKESYQWSDRMKKTINKKITSGNTLVVAFTFIAATSFAQVGVWRSIGPTRMGSASTGRVTTIAIHPVSPSTIYVGARGSGVWKTTNSGTSWNPITDNLPSLTIAAIAIDPINNDKVYVATPEGIFRSDNAGSSWTTVFSGSLMPIGNDGGALIIHPREPNILYLTTANGVLRSSNSGASWSLVLGGGAGSSLVMDRVSPNKLFAAINSMDLTRTGIYATTNGGVTQGDWTKQNGCNGGRLPAITGPTSIKLAFSRSTLYASFKTATSWTLFHTSDIACGPTERLWQPRWNAPGSVGGDPVFRRLWSWLYADPNDTNFVYAAGTDLWFSTNGGVTFTRATDPHVDHHALVFHPGNSKTIYTGCDGGIYRSTNHGANGSWSFLGAGLITAEFYDLADAETDEKVVIAGTQDNGFNKYDGSSLIWKYIGGGDSEGTEIDPFDSKKFYEIGQAVHQLTRYVNDGNATNIGAGLTVDCDVWAGEYPSSRVNQFMVHPKNASILLATCNSSLWRGTPWTTIFTPPSESVIAIAVDAQTDIYYAGTKQGKIYAGVSGSNWQLVFTSPTAQLVEDIEIDRDDPSVLYVGLFNTQAHRVFRLKRTRISPPQVSSTDITSNFPPNLLVQTLGIDRTKPFTVYAGTRRGVYRGTSANQGANWSWTSYNNGLPPADVRNLQVHPFTGVMRAGTFGRGAYEVDTEDPIRSLINVSGRVTLLRVHDIGTKYGPSWDQIDADVIVWLDTQPGKAFGFQLRNDGGEAAHAGMLNRLRDAFNRNRVVSIDYVRTGLKNGQIIRVMNNP